MSKLEIAYTPSETANSYTTRMVEILGTLGPVFELPGRKGLLRRLLTGRRLDAIVLNWPDNAFITEKGEPSTFQFLRALSFMLVYRFSARKVVFVRHNAYPHDTAPAHQRKLARWVDIYERTASVSWVHSKPLATTRRAFIPFPLYKFDKPVAPAAATSERFVLFGRILPYKGIHRLLEVLDPEVPLLVCGTASDEAYLEQLRRLARGRVEIRPGFVSDDDAAALVAGSRGMVVSNNDADMIVSASVMFALSLGVPVYCLRTPYLDWLSEQHGCPLLHVYDSLPDLASALRDPLPPPRNTADWTALFSDDRIRERIMETLAPAANSVRN